MVSRAAFVLPMGLHIERKNAFTSGCFDPFMTFRASPVLQQLILCSTDERPFYRFVPTIVIMILIAMRLLLSRF